MTSPETSRPTWVDTKIDPKIKLSALWAATMFCYVYGDYFELYTPGKLAGMLAGKMGPLGPATQGVLLGVSILMAIPAVMVFLPLVLKPALSRWVNIVLGALYTAVMALAIQGGWTFYQFMGGLEILLTLTIVWTAWKWPRKT